MRATLLHNPMAGAGCYAKEDLVAALRLAGFSVRYCSTKSRNLPRILEEPAELLVAAGGDGTVAKVITQMPDRKVPVAILPLGSANNIARSLSISGNPQELAESWTTRRLQGLNVGVASGPWGRRRFIEAVGLGALAKSIKQKAGCKAVGAEKLRLGREAFAASLRKAKPQDFNLLANGRPLPGDLLAIEILNVGYSGPGLRLAPLAEPCDGLLDLVCIGTGQLADLLAWIEAPYRPLPATVTVLQAQKIAFTWSDTVLRLDDEIPVPPRQPETVTVELEAEAAQVLVAPDPDQSPHLTR